MLRRLFISLTLWPSLGDAVAQTAASPPAADIGASLWQLAFGLAVVLALLVGSLWLLKRLAGPRAGSPGLMRVVAAAAVGTRERVVIVEVGTTWLVLGVAPGQVSALAEVPRQAAAPTAAPAAAADALPAWLRRLTGRA